MSDPWTRSTPQPWPLGAGQTQDNFSGLASGQARCIGAIAPATQSAPWGDLIIPPWKITFNSAPVFGFFQRFLLFTEDNSTPLWPGGIIPNPTAITDQSALLTALTTFDPGVQPLDQIVFTSTNTATTFVTRWHAMRGFFSDGNVPTWATICCYNVAQTANGASGIALATYSGSGATANQITTYVSDQYV